MAARDNESDTAREGSPDGSDRYPIELLARARRVVVKLGTNVLCHDTGELAIGRVYSLLEELVNAHRQGKEVILVSSGAISLGMERLGLRERPETLDAKQACAAVGQIRLMSVYQQAFDAFGITASQVLLTEEDFADRARYLNLRSALHRLLRLRTVPIVNENDTVSTSEIETHLDNDEESVVFGDNDVLSALVASKLGADLLIILSNVDGLHERDPKSPPPTPRLSVVEEITPDIEALATGGSSDRGRGGMRTKLQAAKVATRSGALTVIASGSRPGVVSQILAGEDVGTCFLPRKPMSSRKRWIAFATAVAGRVRINDGARDALVNRRASLLFAGVIDLEREFKPGEIVSILDEKGVEFARGIANYSIAEASRLVGRHSSEASSIRRTTTNGDEGVESPEEFIHRDNIVLL